MKRLFALIVFVLAICPAATLAQGNHEYSPLVEKTVNYKNWTLNDLKDNKPVDLRTLVAGKIAGNTEFKIDGACDHKHRLAARDYPVSDKVLAAFKTFLRDHKELKADESRVDKDADWLKRRIRYEVATAAFGEDNARAALADGDVQLQRAVAELPKAKALSDDIRRMRAASRGDIRRNQ